MFTTQGNPAIERRALTVYLGRAGDRNARAMAGASQLGECLSERTGLPATILGTVKPPLNLSWARELDEARPDLLRLRARYEQLMAAAMVPLTIFGRCACALATLPVIAQRRPDAMVVWFDAHGDANTPQTTTSGYLGGLVLTGAAGLWDSGLGRGLSLSNVLIVGARDLDLSEQALVDEGTLRLVKPGEGIAARLSAAIGASPVYLHIDCDVLEPGIVPTEYCVNGGLTLADLSAACEALLRNEIIGVEIAEFEGTWQNGKPASPSRLIDCLESVLNVAQFPRIT